MLTEQFRSCRHVACHHLYETHVAEASLGDIHRRRGLLEPMAHVNTFNYLRIWHTSVIDVADEASIAVVGGVVKLLSTFCPMLSVEAMADLVLALLSTYS